MKLLIYIIVYPLLWLISLLPFRILFLISDLLSFILFRIIGYRKKVISNNLKLALPNKTEKERYAIQKKFYRHFTDVFIEVIKSITLSKKAIQKRFEFENIEVIQELGKKNKSVILVGSHYANWEWMPSMSEKVPHHCIGVANEIGNKYFDRMMNKNRTKFGGEIIYPRQARKTYIKNFRENKLVLNALVSDQTPTVGYTRHWHEFLNVFIPVHVGAEEMAKTFDQAYVFYTVEKVKRGRYKCHFKLITENPKEFEDYKITEMYLKEVEKQIYEAPEYYFWTHKRFKHKDKYEHWLKNNKFAKNIKKELQ